MTTKTFVSINYDYANPGTMIASFQTKTDNGDGTFTYGTYDVILDVNDTATIVAILALL